MWVIGVLLLMSSMVGLKMVQFEVNAKPIGRQASTPVLAQNMVVYKSAVDVFVASQAAGYTAPAAGNVVPDTSLSFPTWYVRDSRWTNKVINGTVTVYSVSLPDVGDISRDAAKLTKGSRSAGVVKSATNTILSPLYGDTGIALPAGLPNGVPVLQSKIN